MSFNVGPAPSFGEIKERFGEDKTLSEAIKKTGEVQEEYPFVAMGSVLGSEQMYGNKDLRKTSAGLDFISPSVEIERALENSDETWEYNNALVYVDKDEESEWMVAALPFDCCTFRDERQGDFEFRYEDWKNSEFVQTDYGHIEAVPPEVGYTSKLRRYLMQKENREEFKSGDLVDMASMALEEKRNGLMDEDKFEGYLNRYTNINVDVSEMKSDFIDTLINYDLEAELDENDLEDIGYQLDEWH